MRVEIISDWAELRFEHKINERLKRIDEENIIDIKICYCDDHKYTAMIIYKEN